MSGVAVNGYTHAHTALLVAPGAGQTGGGMAEQMAGGLATCVRCSGETLQGAAFETEITPRSNTRRDAGRRWAGRPGT